MWNLIQLSLSSVPWGIFIALICMALFFVLIKGWYKDATFSPISYIVGAVLFLFLSFQCVLIVGSIKIIDTTDYYEVQITRIVDSLYDAADDLNDCNTVAVSKDPDADLALIQLKEKQTPDNCYVFSLKEDDDELSMDDKLFMIGYNRGLTIARTSEGAIQSQTYTGNVTQKGDGSKILYSIPSQHGSSGSPVVNKYGEVVAVNFAGWDDTQGFNYGIPLKKVRQFLRDN